MDLKKFLKLNKRILIISFLIAFILTAFTPHFYLNANYWERNPLVQRYTPVFLEFKTLEKEFAYSSIELLNFKNVHKNVDFKLLSGGEHLLKYRYDFFITRKFKDFNSIIFRCNTDGKVKIILENNINIKSLKINGEECVNKINTTLDTKNMSYTFNVKRGYVYSVNIKANNFHFNQSDINVNAFCFSFLFMFFCCFLIVKYWHNFLKDLKKHRFQIMVFFFLWLIYFIYSNIMLAGIDIYHTISNINNEYAFPYADTGAISLQIVTSGTRKFHSYFFYIFYPLFDILFFLTKLHVLQIILIVYSLINTLIVLLLYNSLNLILQNNKIFNLILTCIYFFSNVVLFFGYIIEYYPIIPLYMMLVLYLSIKLFKNNKKITLLNVILLSLISALTFGVNMVSIIPVFVISLVLVCTLSRNLWKYYLILLFVFIAFLVYSKSLTNNFTSLNSINVLSHSLYIKAWIMESCPGHFCNQTLYKPLLPVKAKFITKPIWIIFSFMIIFSLIIVYKNKVNKEDKIFFITLVSLLLFNFVSNYIWDNTEGFLFAPNHFVLWFLIFAYCVKFIEFELAKHNKSINYKILCSILILFLIVEIPINLSANLYLKAEAIKKCPAKVEYGW